MSNAEPSHSEVVDEILTTVVKPIQVELAEKLIGKSYATTAMLAIAQFLENNDDSNGAEMIRKFAESFADYEATTV